jgi:hypothetical protein
MSVPVTHSLTQFTVLLMIPAFSLHGKHLKILSIASCERLTFVSGKPGIAIAKVHYGTVEARTNWLRERVAQFASILATSEIPDDKLWIGSYSFFERLKLFSIFTKHCGFEEENEWRVVYMRDRDANKIFDSMFGYWVGPRGVEPKLKFKIGVA